MTDKAFDPESERYMIEYMNGGHQASILWYIKAYGNLWDSEGGYIVALDREGMDLDVELPDGERRIRIAFDHLLADESDAQETLIEMSNKARKIVMSQRKQPNPG